MKPLILVKNPINNFLIFNKSAPTIFMLFIISKQALGP